MTPSHDPAIVARVEAIEALAYERLATVAGPSCGIGSATVDGVTVTWFPGDDDPDFSSVTNLPEAHDIDATLAALSEMALAGGAIVLGIDATDALLERLPHERLRTLGFERDYQECTWIRETPANYVASHLPPGVRIEAATASEHAVFARTFNLGFEIAADAVRGKAFATMIGEAGWKHYLAFVDDAPAGVAVLFLDDGIGSFFMASTVPERRGRGAQSALIEARIAACDAAGAQWMTSQSVVGNASPRNFARRGFDELGTYWVYRKPLYQGC